jgi:hypothetical protein
VSEPSFQGNLRRIELGSVEIGRQQTVDSLLPGIGADQVRAALRAAAFESTSDLESWFAWHNGSSGATIGLAQILPGYYPLSVDEAVATAATFRELPGWDPAWLPLLADGGGYFYVVDQSIRPDGLMREFMHDQAECPIQYSSLANFVATVAEAYELRVFTNHPDGFIEAENAVFDRIAAEKNPGIEWWL